jgi:hypothetical protein
MFPSVLAYREIAGLIGQNIETSIDQPCYQKIDDLILISLKQMMHILTNIMLRLKANERQRIAVLVTCEEHTIAYLIEKDGSVYKFDSLIASLTNVSDELMQTLESNKENSEFSGIILFHNSFAYIIQEIFGDVISSL